MGNKGLGWKIVGLLVSIFLIWGGLSGELVLRGTNSSGALVVFGFIFLIVDIIAIATHKRKQVETEEEDSIPSEPSPAGINLHSMPTSQPAGEQKSDSVPVTDSVAKNLTPVEGKAIVYILRPSSMGTLIKIKIECNDRRIGSTKGKQYIYTMLDPGRHTFVSKSENRASLDVTLEAGKIYYIRQLVKMGALYARTGLELMDESNGKKALYSCKLSSDLLHVSMPAGANVQSMPARTFEKKEQRVTDSPKTTGRGTFYCFVAQGKTWQRSEGVGFGSIANGTLEKRAEMLMKRDPASEGMHLVVVPPAECSFKIENDSFNISDHAETIRDYLVRCCHIAPDTAQVAAEAAEKLNLQSVNPAAGQFLIGVPVAAAAKAAVPKAEVPKETVSPPPVVSYRQPASAPPPYRTAQLPAYLKNSGTTKFLVWSIINTVLFWWTGFPIAAIVQSVKAKKAMMPEQCRKYKRRATWFNLLSYGIVLLLILIAIFVKLAKDTTTATGTPTSSESLSMERSKNNRPIEIIALYLPDSILFKPVKGMEIESDSLEVSLVSKTNVLQREEKRTSSGQMRLTTRFISGEFKLVILLTDSSEVCSHFHLPADFEPQKIKFTVNGKEIYYDLAEISGNSTVSIPPAEPARPEETPKSAREETTSPITEKQEANNQGVVDLILNREYSVQGFKFTVQSVKIYKDSYPMGMFSGRPSNPKMDPSYDGVLGIELTLRQGDGNAFSKLEKYLVDERGKRNVEDDKMEMSGGSKYTILFNVPMSARRIRFGVGNLEFYLGNVLGTAGLKNTETVNMEPPAPRVTENTNSVPSVKPALPEESPKPASGENLIASNKIPEQEIPNAKVTENTPNLPSVNIPTPLEGSYKSRDGKNTLSFRGNQFQLLMPFNVVYAGTFALNGPTMTLYIEQMGKNHGSATQVLLYRYADSILEITEIKGGLSRVVPLSMRTKYTKITE